MLTWVGCALVYGFADIDPVIEELVEHSLVEGVAVPIAFASSD
jgi:hypothetical protein